MADKGDKAKRGFAAMDSEKHRALARLGGQTSQNLGKAHRFTSEEAQEAGKIGGLTVSQNRAYMSKIGHRGAVSPRRQRAKAQDQH